MYIEMYGTQIVGDCGLEMCGFDVADCGRVWESVGDDGRLWEMMGDCGAHGVTSFTESLWVRCRCEV